MENISLSDFMGLIIMLGSFISAVTIILKQASKPIKSIEEKIDKLQLDLSSLSDRLNKLEDEMGIKFNRLENKTEKMNRDVRMNMIISKYLIDSSTDKEGLRIKQEFSEYIFNEATKEGCIDKDGANGHIEYT